MPLKIKIERRKKDRRTGEIKKHISHFIENNAIMHLDIIEKLVNKCMRFGVPTEQIEEILNNGYERED